MNRKDELVYVVSPVASDEQVSELHTQIEGVVQRMGGRVEKPKTGAAASSPTKSATRRKARTCWK